MVGGNFSDSPWANDELKIGLSRERNEGRSLVIPVVIGKQSLPAFLQDRIYIDLRKKRYEGVARLLGLLLKIPRQRIEEAVQTFHPASLADLHRLLRYCGISPKIALNKEDVALILASGGVKTPDGCVEFYPEQIQSNATVPPHIAKLMARIQIALRG